jgi:hypothetical protein
MTGIGGGVLYYRKCQHWLFISFKLIELLLYQTLERVFIMTYGYVRVSNADQNEDRQLIAMDEQRIPPARVLMVAILNQELQTKN